MELIKPILNNVRNRLLEVIRAQLEEGRYAGCWFVAYLAFLVKKYRPKKTPEEEAKDRLPGEVDRQPLLFRSYVSGDSSTPSATFTKKTTTINTVCAVASFLLSLGVAFYTALKDQQTKETTDRLARGIEALQNARPTVPEQPEQPVLLEEFVDLHRRVGRIETTVHG
ncbi:hypothetical protein N7516_005747 [Penicillium verrucosum]|uniref:uncharacterized protein n=1 Tax=Penicillium verrucosum TaxID=60171 RepID=UPI0025451F17|nr:uncharacterized protein N7516_005747 [Penicillium verrucosum]KAJ5931258.1 hypothetical protein N7516_005747 [Penicillium verrucosum]